MQLVYYFMVIGFTVLLTITTYRFLIWLKVVEGFVKTKTKHVYKDANFSVSIRVPYMRSNVSDGVLSAWYRGYTFRLAESVYDAIQATQYQVRQEVQEPLTTLYRREFNLKGHK